VSTIPPGPIDHVGIAVRDLERACATYRDLLGGEVMAREVVEAQGVEVAFLSMPGDTRIELIAPIGDEGAVARFLEYRGEGMHHICVVVEDIDAALADLVGADVPLVHETAQPGAEGSRIAFLHPKALGGVLLELKEKAKREPA
jgi:methylmalonyl-CoA/ethylmalonyl-CoA epimerase